MPDKHENTTNFEHIKALVRDLHITRNVSRPDENAVQPSGLSIARNIVHHLNTEYGPHRVGLHNKQAYIEDDASDTNTSSLDLSVSAPSKKSPDSAMTIPSLVVTDVNEPLDLLTTTQRRFSQLYSGLRRLSASHTVGCTQLKSTNLKHWLIPALGKREHAAIETVLSCLLYIIVVV